MNIPEMKNIGTVLRYVLNVASHIVDCLSAVFETTYPLLVVEHHEVGLYSGVCVDPHVDESVDLFGMKFPLLRSFAPLLPIGRFAFFAAKSVVIFDGFSHNRAAVVV